FYDSVPITAAIFLHATPSTQFYTLSLHDALPIFNKAGEVVGLIFDGNIQSLGGDFGYDPAVNRAVAVNVGALREALAKVYHADRDRKSTRLNSSHRTISYAVFCLKKKNNTICTKI